VKVQFFKYQATGNDFVLIDNRSGSISLSVDQVRRICDRKFGVGADGLMLIERHPQVDFNLVYYNSDGSQSLCGNGSRAAVIMAASLGMINGKAKFNAFDGIHEAELLPNGDVKLKMNDVNDVRKVGEDIFINTGSPHYIRFTDTVNDYPVYDEGKRIRYDAGFSPGGTNVNFVEAKTGNSIFVRTYERGVENETLSCGTGVTAAALASSFKGFKSPVNIKTLGGDLSVQFIQASNQKNGAENGNSARLSSQQGMFTEIFLIGPAKLVFEGTLEL
jgi:diaminopimelate epimerase